MLKEMTTLELLYATMHSLSADKITATALRTSATSGTGRKKYSDTVRANAELAHHRLIQAIGSLNEAHKVVSKAIAAHHVAQRQISKEVAQ